MTRGTCARCGRVTNDRHNAKCPDCFGLPIEPVAYLTLDLDDRPHAYVMDACGFLARVGFAPVEYRESASGDGKSWHVRAGAPWHLDWPTERDLRARLGDDANRIRIDEARLAHGYPHGYLYDRKGKQHAGPWQRYHVPNDLQVNPDALHPPRPPLPAFPPK